MNFIKTRENDNKKIENHQSLKINNNVMIQYKQSLTQQTKYGLFGIVIIYPITAFCYQTFYLIFMKKKKPNAVINLKTALQFPH